MTNKIGWGQVGIVLVLSRIFSEAANFPSDDINYGMQRFTVVFLSYILLAVLLIPVFLWTRKNPERSVFGENKLIAVIAVIYLVMAGITTSTRLQFYASSTIFDAAPPWFIIISLTVVCLYGIFKGLPAVMRTGVIIAAGFGLLLLTIIIGVGRDIKLSYLYPALADNTATLFGEVMTELSKNAEAVIFAAVCPRIRRSPVKSFYVFVPVSFVVLILMTFLYNTVLGEYLNITNFPFYALASISDISVLQRLDGLDVVIWIMAAVIKTSLLMLSAFLIGEDAFGGRKAGQIAAFASLGLKAAVSLWFCINTDDFLVYSRLSETALPLIITAFILPLIMLIKNNIRDKKEGKGFEAM